MHPTGLPFWPPPPPPPMPPPEADQRGRTRINDLPDHILESIISHLPAKDLLATSALSRKWRNLHTRAIRLDFDASTPARVVSSVLAGHASSLESCRISHGPFDKLRAFINRLSNLGLRRLSLSCSCSGVPYPAETFSRIATLEELDLHRCSLTDRAPGSGCSALSGCRTLRSLRLHKIIINDTALVSIIDGLPLLQLLVLRECIGLDSLQIASRGLKHLEIEDINMVNMIMIDAPALTLLTMSNLKDCEISTILHAPNLEVLNIYGSKRGLPNAGNSQSRRAGSIDALSLWTGIYENSKLKVDAGMFGRLRSLSIDMNLNDIRQAVVLAFVLKECVMLKELGIINTTALDPVGDDSESRLPYTESEFWERQKFFDCLEYELKLVWIKNFTGEFLELEFVKFLIQICLVLDRIAILHKTDAAEKLACLLPLKRGCPNLSIALMPQLDEEDNKHARIATSTHF